MSVTTIYSIATLVGCIWGCSSVKLAWGAILFHIVINILYYIYNLSRQNVCNCYTYQCGARDHGGVVGRVHGGPGGGKDWVWILILGRGIGIGFMPCVINVIDPKNDTKTCIIFVFFWPGFKDIILSSYISSILCILVDFDYIVFWLILIILYFGWFWLYCI